MFEKRVGVLDEDVYKRQGQDAVNAASAFDEALDVTGVMLTKLDGDARGGAALSLSLIHI